MRVLFWSPGFLPEIGGIEIFASKLMPAMQERGFQYMVITGRNHPGLPAHTKYKDIPIHRFPFWHSLVNIDQLMEVKRKVARLERAFAPDLIHNNAVGIDNFFHLATADACRAPVLMTLHGKSPDQAHSIVAQTLRHADWVTGCSADILEEGRRVVPEITSRSSVINNAVEAPPVPPSPLPFNPPVCLCLGRLACDKGFDVAVSAFRSVIDRIPHARLVIAGDGPERDNLEKQVIHQEIDGSVEFLGWVAPNRIWDLVNSSTLAIIPSRRESFGLVALEAALMARPVVANRVGGIPEVVIDGTTGLLVEKDDTQSLANAIAFLLSHPDVATQIGRAARVRAQGAFSWKAHVDAYDILYRKIISERPS
jgi:glycosyltransferase involved in cell wall biosynthesis